VLAAGYGRPRQTGKKVSFAHSSRYILIAEGHRRRGTQMFREGPAKPFFGGSIPSRASTPYSNDYKGFHAN
jgi:hypothetical protein